MGSLVGTFSDPAQVLSEGGFADRLEAAAGLDYAHRFAAEAHTAGVEQVAGEGACVARNRKRDRREQVLGSERAAHFLEVDEACEPSVRQEPTLGWLQSVVGDAVDQLAGAVEQWPTVEAAACGGPLRLELGDEFPGMCVARVMFEGGFARTSTSGDTQPFWRTVPAY